MGWLRVILQTNSKEDNDAEEIAVKAKNKPIPSHHSVFSGPVKVVEHRRAGFFNLLEHLPYDHNCTDHAVTGTFQKPTAFPRSIAPRKGAKPCVYGFCAFDRMAIQSGTAVDPDISAIAGALHDVATMETGKHENHAVRSLELMDALMQEYHQNNGQFALTTDEILLLKEIIPQHSSKQVISENPYAEMLKDADAIDRYLHGVATKESEKPRLVRSFAELGIDVEFEA